MTKSLDITIEVNSNGDFSVGVLELESSDFTKIEGKYSADDHKDFNERLGNSVYDWITWMMEGEQYEHI